MAKHRLQPTPRRRGTAIAASAVGLSLVLGGVQPVAFPGALPSAFAQTIAETTDIEGRTVKFESPGETTAVPPKNAVGKNYISEISLSPRTEVLPGWTVRFANGMLSAGVANPLPEGFVKTQLAYVDVKFSDNSVKTLVFELKYQGGELESSTPPTTTTEEESDPSPTAEQTTEESTPTTDPTTGQSTPVTTTTTDEPEPTATADEPEPTTTADEPEPTTTEEEPDPSTTEQTTEESTPTTDSTTDPSTPVTTTTADEPEPTTTEEEPDPSTTEQTTGESTSTADPTGEETTPVTSTTREEPKPTTSKPTTSKPTTSKPSTAKPTTPKPTTPKPVPVDQYEWEKASVRAGERSYVYPVRVPDVAVPVKAFTALPEWVTLSPTGMIAVAPPRDTKAGTYTFTVGTDAGERDTISVKVEAAVPDTDRIKPIYRTGFVRAGREGTGPVPLASISKGGATYKDQQLPARTTFSTDFPGATVSATGAVTVSAPLNAEKGSIIQVPVTVRFPDGTTEQIHAPFEVIEADYAQFYQPVYEDNRGAKPGRTVTVNQVKTNLPALTEFSLKDPAKPYGGWNIVVDRETGRISATAPTVNPQPQDFLIHVTYSDGSWEDVPARVEALEGEAESDKAAPVEFSAPYVTSDRKIVLRPDGGIPKGATFKRSDEQQALLVEVDEDGTVTVELPEGGIPGASFDVALQMEFPDGSVRDIALPVQTQSQASKCDTVWPPVPVVENGAPKTVRPTSGVQGAVRYELGKRFDEPGWRASVNPATGELTVARVEALNSPSSTSVPIVISYEDGSQREVEVRVFTSRGAAAMTALTYNAPIKTATLKPGETVKLAPSHQAKSFSLVNPVPGLRTSIDPDTGELTVQALPNATPGERTIQVEATFGDDSVLVTTATVHVEEGATTAPEEPGQVEEADGAVGESSISNGSIAGIVAGLLGLLGLIVAGLYNNREYFQTFLVWWK